MTTPLEPRDPTSSPEQVERLIGQVLSQQPLRSAPRMLRERVLAEIEWRAALPWWRKSFVHWPLGVRMAFVLICLGVVKLALIGIVWLVTGVRSGPVVATISRQLSWAETGVDLVSKAFGVAGLIVHAVPSHWLYGGIALAATLYVAVLILGATAYRALYMNE
jgi:hypothetical protein